MSENNINNFKIKDIDNPYIENFSTINIIAIFNDYYQLYLNGINADIIINLYISKNLFYIFKKDINYTIQDNILDNKECYILEFNKINLGYLCIELNNIEINKSNFNIFLSYLSLFIFNSKYVNRPSVLNCSIFIEVLNMMNDGVIILDDKYIVLFVNKTSEVILSKITSEDNHINKSLYNLFSQLEEVIEYNKIYKNKKINYNVNKNNTDINMVLNINTIIHNNLYYNILTININRLKSIQCDNIGFLSHELRNPLQSISFANQLIQMKLENSKDSKDDNMVNNYKKYLDIIDKSVYDMIKIINDILDIDRINSNQINLTINNVNLDDLIQDIHFNFEKYLTNSNIKFNLILDKNLPTTLFTDSTRIKQIIMNILNNSVKYSKSDSLNTITLTVLHNLELNSIDFSIKDTGIGIKQENINNLMKLKPNITTNKHNSNGIGLFLCNKLALLLGGNIKINSEYMSGSEFVFSHPIELGLQQINIEKNIEKFNIFNKILIVDNDENITLLFKDIIQNLKFKYNLQDEFIIDCCNKGSQVCDIVKLNNYDIIFMDLYISDINGTTLVKLLRKQCYNNKIIGMSSDINYDLNIWNNISPRNSINLNNTENEKILRLYDEIIIKPLNENDILNNLKY